MRPKVAADPKHDRYIMSQTACQRRRFRVPLRRLKAGGDLPRRNHANQRADRRLISSAPNPQSLSRAAKPLHTLSGSPGVSFGPTAMTGAKIKSP
jgi:hypothetical protein